MNNNIKISKFVLSEKSEVKQIIWLDLLDAHWLLLAKIIDSSDLKVNC